MSISALFVTTDALGSETTHHSSRRQKFMYSIRFVYLLLSTYNVIRLYTLRNNSIDLLHLMGRESSLPNSLNWQGAGLDGKSSMFDPNFVKECKPDTDKKSYPYYAYYCGRWQICVNRFINLTKVPYCIC